MKKLIFIILLLIFILGCSKQIEDSIEEQQLANPASVYCEEQGGTLRMEENEAGQTGICILPDETECEEWAYFRGECPEEEVEIFCPDYDENQEECLLHAECKWTSEKNICEPIDMVEEDDGGVEDDEGDEDKVNGFASELEEGLPDTASNRICKKLPLTNEFISSNRYHCLALVNNNAEFCEMIKVDNEEDIGAKNDKNICLAHANEDSSYCEQIEGQDANHVGDDANHVCYFMLAVSSENADFCSDINYLDTAQENKEEKEKCYYGFMSNLYQWGKSDEITTEICGHMEDEMEKTCLALKARDISMCGSNPNCLTYFEQPLSFCDEHSNFVSCMKDRAKTSKDVSICELLPQPDRDVCVGVYCTHTELDVNICDTIERNKKRQEFYVELAMNLGNDVRGND